MNLRNLLWSLSAEFLLVLGLIGVWTTRQHCARLIRQGSLQFGFTANPPVETARYAWLAMGRHATVMTTLSHPVLSFSYRPLNTRAAQFGEVLSVFLNGVHTLSLPLTTVSQTVCYCDVTGLSGSVASIEFEASRTFVPLKEKWFDDPRAYGALVSPLSWYDDAPTSLVGRATGIWSTQWSGAPEEYIAYGYPTDRTFRVEAIIPAEPAESAEPTENSTE